ncbi:hypothetical protein GGR41_000582 [Paenalcaligenes hominis]|uniref:Uncharacterized protein n=1 Tax=Paenalcaligenes hominis TaxID=643674 RepID=A0ABX0WM98_9BURK|nr:hypothetical protein [Paenalcaligenes hominis]NJB64361.1 hypothetical protein [Paenalcaligenes hominis]GGE68210.1 hypothetical protein GCM10007278_15400 [Paenalcaligenes hominis]
MSLVIVKPVVVTDEMLIDSNVPVDDYLPFDPDETYSVGARVVLGRNIYESLADENQGNDPLNYPDKWLSPGVVNRWRAFDDQISSRAMRPNLITYRIKTGRAANSIGILNLTGATEVKIRVEDPLLGVYEKTQKVNPITPQSSWWHWYYGYRKARNQALFLRLPSYPRAEICIEIKGGEKLGVGLIVLGQQRRFGIGVEYGARAGITSYSRVRRDSDSGEVDIRKGRSSKRSTFNLAIRNTEVDQVYDFMSEVDSVPVLMIATDSFKAFTGYGLIKHFEVVVPNVSTSDCSIEFDGFI